jgi:hypothetical protein
MKPGSVDHGIWRESTHGNPTFDITTIAIRHRSDSEFKDYRGIAIGMTAAEVRAKLERLKKGDGQDFLVFSEHESAQIYYDDNGNVTAISIDYFGDSQGPHLRPCSDLGSRPKLMDQCIN